VGVVVVFVMGMRAGHGVGGEGGEVVARTVGAVTVVRVYSRGIVVGMMGCALAFELGGRVGEDVDILSIVGTAT
jgi:hypothetical protein